MAKRVLWPLGAALAGMLFLTSLYFGLVFWAEGYEHAVSLFQEDLWFVLPIILGFGIQAALYTILKKRLFAPAHTTGHGGKLMGASGGTSTVAMVACCVHHVTDVLPILGLTVAATFLAQYRILFMLVGLTITWLGVLAMSIILVRERYKAVAEMVHGELPATWTSSVQAVSAADGGND